MASNSATSAPPPAIPPEVADALSRVEGGGAILALWIPLVAFGHLFAAIFLIHGLFLYMPNLKRRLNARALLGRWFPGLKRNDPAADAVGSEGAPKPTLSGGGGGTATGAPPGSRLPRRNASADGGPGRGPSGAVFAPAGDQDAEGAAEEEAEEEDDIEGGGFLPSRRRGERSSTQELHAPSTALEAALAYDEGDGQAGAGGAAAVPLAQVVLEWRGLTLAVSGPRGVITVLRDVGGRAPAGAVTALMGPSGAGKSTLLDLLAIRGAAAVPEGPQQLPLTSSQRQQQQQPMTLQHPPAVKPYTSAPRPSSPGCSGQVLVNGVPRDSKAFLAMSSYVPQVDAFLPQLTVREALLFTGRLVLPPPQCRPTAVAARADAVAAALGLGGQMGTLIGGVLPGGLLLRGLSGGERKRLSIGQGLMSRPRLLLLDEPTSGLDSFAAAVVMGHLAALAAGSGSGGRGMTVVASLHQPRAAIWDLVNQVVVLGRGRLLYCGPPSELLPWFGGRLGYCYRPQHHGLVSDWIMDLVAMTTTGIITDPRVGSVEASPPPAAIAAEEAAIASMEAMREDLERTADGKSVGSVGGGVGKGANDDASAPAREVMTTLAELNAAADAFLDAVLTVPPAPGVSAGVPDYANVLAAAAASAATAATTAAEPGGLEEVTAAAAVAPGFSGESATSRSTVGSSNTSNSYRTGTSGNGRSSSSSSSSSTGQLRVPHGTYYPGPPTHGTAAAPGAVAPVGAAASVAAAAGRWLRQYRMLVWREWLIATRNPADVAGRMLTFVWVGIFASFLAYDLPTDATSIFLRSALLFAMLFFFIVMPFVFMSLFTADKRFFLLEASTRGAGGGLYAASAYYAAKVSATSPLNMIIAITFDWIGYGMIGMRHTVLAAVQNTTCAVLMSLIALQWVQAAVAFTPNQDLAFCASVAFVVLNLLLSTQFLGTFKLSFSWIGRLRAISALDHSWRGLMWAEFRNRAFLCGPVGSGGMLGIDALGLLPQFLPDNPNFGMIRVGMTQEYDNCVVDTNALLSNFHVNVPTGTAVGYLFAYLAVVHLITYLSLRQIVRRQAAVGGGGGGLWGRLRRAVGLHQ